MFKMYLIHFIDEISSISSRSDKISSPIPMYSCLVSKRKYQFFIEIEMLHLGREIFEKKNGKFLWIRKFLKMENSDGWK